MSIPAISTSSYEITAISGGSSVIRNVYTLGKRVLNYFVQNQYALAGAIWSYMIIKVGVATAKIFVRSADSDDCLEIMCSYWKNSSTILHPFRFPHIPCRCAPAVAFTQIYSLEECLHDMCQFLNDIGKTITECLVTHSPPTSIPTFNPSTLSVINDKTNDTSNLWEKFCLGKATPTSGNLNNIMYLKRCVKKVCGLKIKEVKANTHLQELCTSRNLEKLHGVLKEIISSKNYLRRKTKSLTSTDIAALVAGLLGGIGGIVGGVATMVSTVITFTTAKAATTALKQFNLGSGLGEIAKTAVTTTISLVDRVEQEAVIIGAPPALTTTLTEVKSRLESEASSLSTDSELGSPFEGDFEVQSGELKKIKDTIPKILTRYLVSPTETDIQGQIYRLYSNVAQLVTSHPQKDTQTILFGRFAPSCLSYSTDSLLYVWSDCLRESLPSWNNARCLYDQLGDYLLCRLPTVQDVHQSFENYDFLQMRTFFIHYPYYLCGIFNSSLWCNFNEYFKQTHSLVPVVATGTSCGSIDGSIPLQQLNLTVNLDQQSYRLDFTGDCYGEIAFIKV